MNYQESFENRVESFLYAVNNFNCYDNELKVAINYLEPEQNETIVNLGGGGINIQKFLSKDVNYIPLEFSKEFSQICNIPYIDYKNIPLENNTIDKFLILALLHHFNKDERDILYKEIYRCLKKDGKFVLADVIKNSKQDFWLNKIVDRFNPYGHIGIFFNRDESDHLEKIGFHVDVYKIKYYWEFQNEKEMCQFMKSLFYLNISDEYLLNTLYNTFIIKEGSSPSKKEDAIQLEWELIYFICTK